MKKCLVFSLIFFAKIALSQVNDNFDDGNFSNNPVWTGSNSGSDFTVVNNQLRSNSTTTNSSFYLSTPNSLANNCIWEFYCNLQLATSGANYADVYLISDQQNLSAASLNGYFVRIGNTSDEISLYKRSGTNSVKLIDGADGSINSSNNRVKIRVTRTSANEFTLERDLSGTGASYVPEGSVSDGTFIATAHFGIYVAQSTASFFQKHFFDDISVREIIPDKTPPKMVSVAILSDTSLQISFDEPVDETSAKDLVNYSLSNGFGNPVSATSGSGLNQVILNFSSPFSTGNYILTASEIADKNGNKITTNNISFSYIKPYVAKRGDIVINEIFADPSPQVDLPGAEFIELWNTSTETISLKGWKYSDAGSTAVLPAITLAPDDYLIVCAKADTAEFKTFGNVLGISPWPSLNNASDLIKLVSSENTPIDSVVYRDTWYREADKKVGGWTLELTDPKAICTGSQNWMASVDLSGGTPGRKNSVFQANKTDQPLKLVNATIKDSVTVILSFNRMIDSLSASLPDNYRFNNGLGNANSVVVPGPDFSRAILKFPATISRGKRYEVSLSGISDCAGIQISPTDNTASFLYSDKIQPGDILISEILFNPRPEGVDFVEIYNHSKKILDVRELTIATRKADTISSPTPLSSAEHLLTPGNYLVLTTDPDKVRKEYYAGSIESFLKMNSLPSYNNDAGNVVLFSNEGISDEFSYSSKMHFGLIKDPEGVSLERTSFSRAANEPGNFHSAASSVGFATPGYKNSQAIEDIESETELSLASKTFSPDNDGFEDALSLNYRFNQAGLVANSAIYNDRGVLIKRIAKNLTLATSGTLTWDGLDENSSKAAVGIYIVYFEVFDLNGKVRKYRKSCVLAAKL